jgi:hypothetical protein
MMNALDKFKLKARQAAQLLDYEVKYLPGLVEELDQYQVSHSVLFNISCYGASKESALKSAINEAQSLLIENPELVRDLLKIVKN